MGSKRTGRSLWTKAMRDAFLDHLAATCNVREAAAAAGGDPISLYSFRRADPSFASEWESALQLGYQMLETRIVGHALAGKGVTAPVEREGYLPVDTHLALTLLTTHRNALNGIVKRGGPKLKQVSEDETNAALLRKLEAMERKARRGV